MVAPIRRPVKEPGPDINSIFLISCQVLPFSASLSLMNPNSFSAKLLAKAYLYSLSSSLNIVSGVLVSKYSFISVLYHRSIKPTFSFAMTSRHVIFYNVSLNPRLDQVIRLASQICNFTRLG